MLKNPAGWLAIGVLAIATIVMVFFVMPRISEDKQPLGAAINEAGKQVEQAVAEGGKAAQELVEPTKPQEQAATTPSATATPSASSAATPSASSAATPAQNTPAPAAAQATASDAPTFDVLRVEPDGSTVIAGRAAPGTKLEITDKNSVLAKADVASGGEFAAILDNPLPPGDHELVLKVTGKDGKTVVSEEVATISVPAVKGGELLAMVTKPGEASRLIATPATGEQKQAKTERVAAPQAPAPAKTPEAMDKPASDQVAVASPDVGNAADKTDVAGQKAEIQVTAVEIEGDRLFVAGIAKPQAKLRGYADEALIGNATAAANGHFVIDGKMPLSVGDHRIAVDQIGPDGKALVRVAVPFNRPVGDQVAAVASPSTSASGKALAPIDGGAFDRLRNQVALAHEILTGLYANGAVPTIEQLAAARSATMIALNSLTQYRLPAGAGEEARRIAEMTVAQATAALKALEALPRDVAEFGKGLAEINTIIASAIGPVVDTPPTAQAAAPAEVAASTSSDDARTIEQAPLTQSENASVIIRRGDTLWQISRRVYGQGVRYTTIYLANEDKIANPDLIQPGQVFGVPDEARPDAEELHRQRMQKDKS